MNAIIKIHSDICNLITSHSKIDKTRECGGFLFGKYYENYDNIIVIVNGIYYERIFGSKNRFEFSQLYYNNAVKFGKSMQESMKNFKLIGCYHSHAECPLYFSDEDRNLERFFGKKTCSLIYSPITNKLIGDVITNELISIPARITIYNKKNDYEDYPILTRKPSSQITKL